MKLTSTPQGYAAQVARQARRSRRRAEDQGIKTEGPASRDPPLKNQLAGNVALRPETSLRQRLRPTGAKAQRRAERQRAILWERHPAAKGTRQVQRAGFTRRPVFAKGYARQAQRTRRRPRVLGAGAQKIGSKAFGFLSEAEQTSVFAAFLAPVGRPVRRSFTRSWKLHAKTGRCLSRSSP